MKTIKLEDATKAEIIQAIELEFSISDVRIRIERLLHDIRVQALLNEMRQACDDMKANRQNGEVMDWSKRDRWTKANSRWNRVNNELTKLQGL